jgi:hypothetical protein
MLWTTKNNTAWDWYEKIGGHIIGEKDWGGNSFYGVQVKEVTYGLLDIKELIR